MGILEDFNDLYIPDTSIDTEGIKSDCINIPFEKINKEIPSRFITTIGSAKFNCYFHENSTKVLFVFLPGARGESTNPLPRFSRWSRSSIINGCTLCIEDPMYYTYPELKYGWFIGTEKENYTEYLSQLINKIAEQKKIKDENIVLFGSSAGGSVAINCSQYLKKAITISVNPQYLPIAPKEYDNNFYKITKHHIDDYKDRIDIKKSIDNENNIILLALNKKSKEDRELFNQFCRNNNICDDKDILVYKNTIMWKFNAPGTPNPHMSYENQTTFPMFILITSILININNANEIYKYEPTLQYLSNLWNEKYSILLEKTRIEYERSISDEKTDIAITSQQLRSYLHYGHEWAIPLLLKINGEEIDDINKKIELYQKSKVITETYIDLLIQRHTNEDINTLNKIFSDTNVPTNIKTKIKKSEYTKNNSIEVDFNSYQEIIDKLKKQDLGPFLEYIRREKNE